MSVAANAESVLSYSFTHYIPLYYKPVEKEYQANNGDLWELRFKDGFTGDSSVRLDLIKRNEIDCSFMVKLSIVDEERQSKLDLVQKGWKCIGTGQTFWIPHQVISGLRNAPERQLGLQMSVTKIVQPSMSEELSKLFKSESFGDVEIECGDGEKFRCHKDMLVARSHHFATMFNLKMKESVENRIRIEDFSSEVVSVLLRFCYLGDWGDISNVADGVYKAADRYQLEQLKLAATAELIVNLNANSIVSTLRLAHLYKDELLADGCVNYMASHKGDLSAIEVMAEAAKKE